MHESETHHQPWTEKRHTESMNSSYFLKGIGSNIKCNIVACRSSTSDVLLSYSYLIKPASGKIASVINV